MKKDNLKSRNHRDARAFSELKKRRTKNKRNREKFFKKRVHRQPRSMVSLYHEGVKIQAQLARNAKIDDVPRVLDLVENPEASIGFFQYIREILLVNAGNRFMVKKLRPRKTLTLKGYFAIDRLESISTSAALILAAEYERKMDSMLDRPYLVNLDRWSPSVVRSLSQIGFFDILGITLPNEVPISKDDDIYTVKFYSGTDASKMQIADERLEQLISHLYPELNLEDAVDDVPDEIVVAINSGISEAMTNVRNHAYSDPGFEFKYPHVNKWWATGSARRSSNEVVISMFDQGMSIPITYPKLPLYKRLIDSGKAMFSTEATNEFSRDGELIKIATTFGNTQTSQGHRGNGLPQMKNTIDICGEGSLLVISRNGHYLYEVKDGKQSEKFFSLPNSIGGTLIEWTVKIPETNNDN